MKRTVFSILSFVFAVQFVFGQAGMHHHKYIQLHKRQTVYSVCGSINISFKVDPSLAFVDSMALARPDDIYHHLPKAYLLYTVWGKEKSDSYLDGLSDLDPADILYAKAFLYLRATSDQSELCYGIMQELEDKYPNSMALVNLNIDKSIREAWSRPEKQFKKQMDSLLTVVKDPEQYAYLALAKAEYMRVGAQSDSILLGLLDSCPQTINMISLFFEAKHRESKDSLAEMPQVLRKRAVELMGYRELSIEVQVDDLLKRYGPKQAKDTIFKLLDKCMERKDLEPRARGSIAKYIYQLLLHDRIGIDRIRKLGFSDEQLKALLLINKAFPDLVTCAMQQGSIFSNTNGTHCASLEDFVGRLTEKQKAFIVSLVNRSIIAHYLPFLVPDLLPLLAREEEWQRAQNNEELKALLLKNPIQVYDSFLMRNNDWGTILVLKEVVEKYPGVSDLIHLIDFLQDPGKYDPWYEKTHGKISPPE